MWKDLIWPLVIVTLHFSFKRHISKNGLKYFDFGIILEDVKAELILDARKFSLFIDVFAYKIKCSSSSNKRNTFNT